VKQFVAAIIASGLISACTGSRVEEGLFFPTWRAEGAVPSGIVQGTLVEDDRCLHVETGNQRTLVAWEDGIGFDDGTLLDASGSPIAQVGEVIHGRGGYFGSRGHIEALSGESIPERCVPDGENRDPCARSRQVRSNSPEPETSG
jgi:hypothetical protein